MNDGVNKGWKISYLDLLELVVDHGWFYSYRTKNGNHFVLLCEPA